MTRVHPELWGIEYTIKSDGYAHFTPQYRAYGATAKNDVSNLCAADKLAFCLENEMLYKIRAIMSGESVEFCQGYENFDDCYNDFWWSNWGVVTEHCIDTMNNVALRTCTRIYDERQEKACLPT